MAGTYQILSEMESAQTAPELLDVLRLRAGDLMAIEDRGGSADIKSLRAAALVNAERVTGLSFAALIASALDQPVT